LTTRAAESDDSAGASDSGHAPVQGVWHPLGLPAPTKSGHMESSTLKRQHAKAIQEATKILRKQTRRDDASFQGFELYTLRHMCLTRWEPHMDPWTLA
jgi:hypothetical protein